MNSFDLEPSGGALRLQDWGVLLAEGPDAAAFLHGQLTQSVQSLREDRARLAGYCSAKGRLMASFVVCQLAENRIALLCSADLLETTRKRLSMFVLRAKCKLVDASSTLQVWGLVGASAAQWLGEPAARAVAWHLGQLASGESWVRLPSGLGEAATPRWLLLRSETDALPPLPALSAAEWMWREVRSGVPRITAATADHFVPQMVNFELVGGVDFQKGCYPGQEVVARSQYRGTLKRRMFAMHSSQPLMPGSEVFHSSDPQQPAGEVVLAAAAPGGGGDALVELKLAMLDTGTEGARLTAGVAELRVAELPYAVNAPN
jgi:tRNA-modifying protein YgfZ